jgi:rare lipoprotein A
MTDRHLAKRTFLGEIVFRNMGPETRFAALRRRRSVWLMVAATTLLGACARKRPIQPPIAPIPGSVEVGIASWYGYPYHGRRAANGEIYDMEKLTAAHRTLPFDTWVEVLNLSNHKTVQVRINDRGPFIDGRIIDLSRAAARQIAMMGPGTAQVRIKVIVPPQSPVGASFYAVQVGAFQDRKNAERLQQAMKARYGDCRLALRDGDPQLWRVLVGREPTLEAARALALQLHTEPGSAFVVRLDERQGDGL